MASDYKAKHDKKNSRPVIVLVILFLILAAAGVFISGQIRQQIEAQKAAEEEAARLAVTPPVIELTGDDTVKLLYGEEFTDPGYAATDAYGDDITGSVEVKVPKLSHSGKFKVRYSVTDKNGNTADAVRTVKVRFPKQTEEGKARGLSVLMYHKVVDPENPPEEGIDANCVSKGALEEEFKYLIEEGYYFPTWKEVRNYLDGKIDLPEKSVCLTFDDGTQLFEKYGVPLIKKYDVRATAFIIGSKNGDHWVKKKYKHLWLESHSYDMHRPGGYIGHGGVFTALSHDEALADLKKSIKQLGSSGAFAYPFGDYNEACVEVVREAGFLCAFTTEYGRIYPGYDPAKLPRVRVNGSPSLEQFKGML